MAFRFSEYAWLKFTFLGLYSSRRVPHCVFMARINSELREVTQMKSHDDAEARGGLLGLRLPLGVRRLARLPHLVRVRVRVRVRVSGQWEGLG